MQTWKRTISPWIPGLLAGIAVGSAHARADTLKLEAPKDTYELYEPIVVRVELRLDDPYVRDPANPAVSAKEQRRVMHRRLDPVLRGDEGHLCEGMSLIPAFQPREDGQTVFRESGLVIVGKRSHRPGQDQDVFESWAVPGRYRLAVVDRDNGLESNEVSIAIHATEGSLLAAGEVFGSVGWRIGPALIGGEHGEPARPILQQLVSKHEKSVFGAYARMSLTLLNVRRLYEGLAREKNLPLPELAQELQRCADRFAPGHPLRSRAILYLARAQASPRVAGEAEDTIGQLLAETGDGHFIHEVELLRAEMARRRAQMADSPTEPAGGRR